jgi:hypothetical protein
MGLRGRSTGSALRVEVSKTPWRRWAACLALLLTCFASVQPVLAASRGPGQLRYLDVSLVSSGSGERHDHRQVLCHSCAGHICLEQHGALDLPSLPLAILPAAADEIPVQPVAALWPHPPTAPPAERVGYSPQARAPPFS